MERLGVVLSISGDSLRNAICDELRIAVGDESRTCEIVFADDRTPKNVSRKEADAIEKEIENLLDESKGNCQRVIVVLSLPRVNLIEDMISGWFSKFFDDLTVVGVEFSPPPGNVVCYQPIVGVRSVGDLRQGINSAIREVLTAG